MDFCFVLQLNIVHVHLKASFEPSIFPQTLGKIENCINFFSAKKFEHNVYSIHQRGGVACNFMYLPLESWGLPAREYLGAPAWSLGV